MLLELLEKRNKNEKLTEEELKILAEYDAQVAEQTKALNEKLVALETEVKTANNGKTTLEEKIKTLNTQLGTTSQQIEKILKEKEELEKKVVETNPVDIEEIKSVIRRSMELKQEEAMKREKLKQEELVKAKEEELNKKLQQLEEELKKQAEINKFNAFKSELAEEKIKRPYLVSQIEKIIKDLDTVGVQQSRLILNFLIDSVNHEEELEAYIKRQKAGSNIFDGKQIKTKTNESESSIDPFEKFLKKKKNIK